ncbi:MAG: hypothetical protein K8T20_08155 [Planctomycetes bacterium]|nr:hypothetical protein [Planctomycetota bacterium]
MGTRHQQMIRILDTLETNGWRRAAVLRDCDHWADEVWELRSVHPPVGTKAWMVFLIDPEWTGYRAKGEGVIAVAADTARRKEPTGWLVQIRRKEPTGWLVQIPLGRRWERGLLDIMEALQTTRAAKLQIAQEASKQVTLGLIPPRAAKSRNRRSL